MPDSNYMLRYVFSAYNNQNAFLHKNEEMRIVSSA